MWYVCVRDTTYAEECGLRADATEGNHGEAAVLELLQPHLPLLGRLLRQELLAKEVVAGIAWDGLTSINISSGKGEANTYPTEARRPRACTQAGNQRTGLPERDCLQTATLWTTQRWNRYHIDKLSNQNH